MRGTKLLLILIILSSFAYSFEVEAESFETNICTPGTTQFTIHNYTDSLEFITDPNTQINLINVSNQTANFELTHTSKCLQTGTVKIPIQIKDNNTITTTKIPLTINKDSTETYSLNGQELTSKSNILTYCNETKLNFRIFNANPYETLYKWNLNGDFQINKSLNIQIKGNEAQTTSFILEKNSSDFGIQYYNILTKKQYEYDFYLNKSTNCTGLTLTPTHVFEMNWPLLIGLIILTLLSLLVWQVFKPRPAKNEVIIVSNTKSLKQLKPEAVKESKNQIETKTIETKKDTKTAKKTKTVTKKKATKKVTKTTTKKSAKKRTKKAPTKK